jgi:hypothetical protein
MLTSIMSWLIPQPEPTLAEILKQPKKVERSAGQLIYEFCKLMQDCPNTLVLELAIAEAYSADQIEQMSNKLGRIAHDMHRKGGK